MNVEVVWLPSTLTVNYMFKSETEKDWTLNRMSGMALTLSESSASDLVKNAIENHYNSDITILTKPFTADLHDVAGKLLRGER